MKKKKFSDIKKSWWKYVLAIFLIVIYLFPIYVLVVMSLKERTDFSSRLLPPTYLYLDNFTKVIENGQFFSAVKNTLIISTVTVFSEVVFGCAAAYPLSRNRDKFNNVIYSLCLGVMMVPALSILVGVYTEMVKLDGINHLWSAIVIGVCYGLPLSINMYVNFITAIPVSLDEAAIIDGAGCLKTFWYVIMPQLKPVTTSIIILKFVSAWNDYLYPSYFLQKPSKYTLVLLIKQYFGSSTSSVDLNGAAAVAVLCIAPIIILYLYLQKYFIQGQIDSAVK